jgi:ethanolamine ammonia-lyase small subunit
MTTYFELRVYDHAQDIPTIHTTTQLGNLEAIVDHLREQGIDEAGGVTLVITDGLSCVSVDVAL